MKVLLLLALAVSAQAAVPDPIAGRYVAVTETEYSITLTLEPKGAAEFEFLTWEADGSAPEQHQRFFGTWYRHAGRIIVLLASGKTATFVAVRCLSHQEFGEVGCSPGLSLVKATIPDRYGLKRFGLWNSAYLKDAHLNKAVRP